MEDVCANWIPSLRSDWTRWKKTNLTNEPFLIWFSWITFFRLYDKHYYGFSTFRRVGLTHSPQPASQTLRLTHRMNKWMSADLPSLSADVFCIPLYNTHKPTDNSIVSLFYTEIENSRNSIRLHFFTQAACLLWRRKYRWVLYLWTDLVERRKEREMRINLIEFNQNHNFFTFLNSFSIYQLLLHLLLIKYRLGRCWDDALRKSLFDTNSSAIHFYYLYFLQFWRRANKMRWCSRLNIINYKFFFNLIMFGHSTRAIKIISIKSHVNASRLRLKI